jgi:ATP phosphoribosyltransferase regulatory subunit
MTGPAAPTVSAAWADTLLQSFAQAGYIRAEPAILQPAEPFLDLSGEDIRKSLYLTTDSSGEELCLRPDLTIPVARDYLSSGRAGQPAGFSYLGPVFRYRGGRPSEFLQAGVESFGRHDRAAADAEMLALAIEATAAVGVGDIEIRTGDVALFIALIDALDLYPVWRRRLIKDFNRKVTLEQDLERLTVASATSRNEYEGVLAALAGSDRKAALALVTDLMSIAGTTAVGGRSVAEIADRFLEQSTLKGGALPRDALNLIKRFLGIGGDPIEAVAQLRALAADASLDIAAAIDLLEARVGFMAKRGIDIGTVRFATAFGRGLDYYTGFEFELHRKGDGVEPLVAGGRYDGLMSQLGAAAPIPAVGFSIWVEALTQVSPSSAPSRGRAS